MSQVQILSARPASEGPAEGRALLSWLIAQAIFVVDRSPDRGRSEHRRAADSMGCRLGMVAELLRCLNAPTNLECRVVKSDVETLNPTRVKLTVEVPFDELKPSLDAAYKTIGSQINVPGFRAGKVPARIIDQRVGRGAVLQEAVNDALPRFYGQAVEENKIRPLGQPDVDVTEVPAEEGQDLKFTIEVDVRPELVLPDYEGIAIEVDVLDGEATDADVEARMTALRQRFGTLTGVERVAALGDFVSIDLTAAIGEEEIDTAKGISYEIGSGNMIDGLDDALAGMAVDETKIFTAPLSGGEHEGKDADINVTVQSVKERVLPDLDDDFAQLASEFDTLDELRADIQTQAERAKKMEQGVQARDKVLEHLLDNTDIPIPDALVEAEVKQHLEGESRLEDDEHRAEVDENTRKAMRSQFLLDAIAYDEGAGEEGHDHEGHDHEGHDHEGHDHEGHDHEGHDHEGHDHEGHD